MKRLRKIIIRFFLSLSLLIILAWVFSQTQVFKDWLKNVIARNVSAATGADLTIDQLTGDLYSQLIFRDIRLSQGKDTLAVISELEVSYHLPALWYKRIQVNELLIRAPQLNISRDEAGRWNINKLFVSPDTTAQTDTSSAGFDYSVILESFQLTGGSIVIDDTILITPEKISDLNISLSGSYRQDDLAITLDSISLKFDQPDLQLRKLGLEFALTPDEISVRNISLKTGRNQITAEARLDTKPVPGGNLHLTGQSVDLDDIDVFLKGFRLKNRPELDVDVQFGQDTAQIDIDILAGQQMIDIHAEIQNYSSILSAAGSKPVDFDLRIGLDNFNIGDWLVEKMPELSTDGKIAVTGSFTRKDILKLTATGQFSRLAWQKFSDNKIDFNSVFQPGKLAGNVILHSPAGLAEMTFRVADPGGLDQYDADVRLDHLNIQHFLPGDTVISDLNLSAKLNGKGISNGFGQAEIELTLNPSVLAGYDIEKLYTHIQMQGSHYRLDTLDMDLPAASLQMSGQGDIKGVHDLHYAILLREIGLLSPMAGADTMSAKGSLAGYVTGKPDSLTNQTDFDLHGLRFNDIGLENLAGNVSFSLQDTLTGLQFDLAADSLRYANLTILNLNISSQYDAGWLKSILGIQYNRDIKIDMIADLNPDTVLILKIPQITALIFKEEWHASLEQLSFNPASEELQVDKFMAQFMANGIDHEVSVNGKLSRSGSQDMEIIVRNLNLNRVLSDLGLKVDFGGDLDFNILLQGTAEMPLLEGGFDLKNGFSRALKFKGIRSRFNYADNRFNVKSALNLNDTDSLVLAGYLPLHLSLSNKTGLIHETDQLDIRLRSGEMPVALFLNNLPDMDLLAGTFNCDLQLTNKLEDPQLRGFAQVRNGAIKSTFWGIDYNNIDILMTVENQTFTLDRFHVDRETGKLDIAGKFLIDPTDSVNVIDDSDLRLTANNFYLVKHKDFEIQVTSDIRYTGQKNQPRISGSVDINRSSFYLPVVLGRLGSVAAGTDEKKPMLVSAKEKRDTATGQRKKISGASADSLVAPGFLDKLKGNLTLRMPRNTWIRNPQLRVELEGDLNLNMDEGKYVLTGPVEIVRGQYDILGRRFTVISGKIDFQGRKDVSPPVSLEAEYDYRTTGRDKKTLLLKVGGSLDQLQITFFDNNMEITQDDAVSIILFNRKKDELNFSSQGDVAQSDIQSAAAMGIVSNLVSDRLSRKLGDDLKLDVIEVNAQDNWKSANFVVGKYITNDIFVTYTRAFGQSTDNEIVPETISLEYEITKFLFLQMLQGDPKHSGIDMFLKFDFE